MTQGFEGKKMRAVRLIEYNKKYEVAEVDIPSIGANDILIKVGGAGFCHTDYQVYTGTYKSPVPLIPSHEPAGTVAAVGSQASSNWKVGQRVGMLNFRHPCKECGGCKKYKDPRFCERKDKVQMAGINSDGGFAEYVVADAETTVLLPEGLEFEQAAPLMCAGTTVWAGIQSAIAQIQPGEPIGIIGIGGLGSYGIQFAKALGYRTVAIDNRDEGLALASEVPIKPDLIVDYRKGDAAISQIKEWAGEGGLAAVVTCTDDIPVNEWALKLLRVRGTAVVIGLPEKGFHFDAFDLVYKELRLKGSLLSSVEQCREMVKCVDKFGISTKVTTVGLEECPELTERYMRGDLKGRLVMKI